MSRKKNVDMATRIHSFAREITKKYRREKYVQLIPQLKLSEKKMQRKEKKSNIEFSYREF